MNQFLKKVGNIIFGIGIFLVIILFVSFILQVSAWFY